MIDYFRFKVPHTVRVDSVTIFICTYSPFFIYHIHMYIIFPQQLCPVDEAMDAPGRALGKLGALAPAEVIIFETEFHHFRLKRLYLHAQLLLLLTFVFPATTISTCPDNI